MDCLPEKLSESFPQPPSVHDVTLNQSLHSAVNFCIHKTAEPLELGSLSLSFPNYQESSSMKPGKWHKCITAVQGHDGARWQPCLVLGPLGPYRKQDLPEISADLESSSLDTVSL